MLLEGLEVVFIVITFGANQRNVGAAVIGAAAAVVVVTVTGIAVRAPLAKVPENAMKFAVGIMLTSFGTFWGAEGAGVSWPGHDAACWCSRRWWRWSRSATRSCSARPRPGLAPAVAPPPRRWQLVRRLKSIGAFWYDFVVGDDWRVAVVVVIALALTALLVHAAGVNAWWLVPVCVFAALGWSLRRATARPKP